MSPALADATLDDALAVRHGKDLRAYFAAHLEAKREFAEVPVRALVGSALWAHEEGRPVIDLEQLAADPAQAGESWLEFAEALYSGEQFELSAQALARVGDGVGRAQAVRVASLQNRLAMRGHGRAQAGQGGDGADVASLVLTVNQASHARAGRTDPAASRDAAARLRRIAARPDATPAVRDRALVWAALLHLDAGQGPEGLSALAGIDGASPLAADALLAWLRAQAIGAQRAVAPKVALPGEANAADSIVYAALAAERQIGALVPNSAAAWEAREGLVRILIANQAYGQAGDLAVKGFESAFEQFERADRMIARLEKAPFGDLLMATNLLAESRRQRIGLLLQRRASLQTTERVLNAWLPYLFSYRTRLQKDPAQFATEIRDVMGAQRSRLMAAARGEDFSRDRAGLLRQDIAQFAGSAAVNPRSYRLFAGAARWELGAAFGPSWTPESGAGELPRALDLSGQVADLFAAQYAPAFSPVGPEAAERAKALSERSNALVNEIRNLIPVLERAVAQEVVAGLAERRRLSQQWMNRLAHYALEAFQRQDHGSAEPKFDLAMAFSPKAGSPVLEQLGRVGGERKAARFARTNLSTISSALRSLAENGATPAVRIEAMRLQARIVITYREAQFVASADEAVGLYQRLLKSHGDAIDRPETTYQLARAQELSKNPADMIETLKSFSNQYPGDPRAREATFRIGEANFSAGDYAAARSAYEKVMAAGDSRYRDQAEFKLGWSLYKLGAYRESLPVFLSVIDRTDAGRIGDRYARERVKDSFRAMALAFSNLEGAAEAERFLTRAGRKQYIPDLQVAVALLYLERERIQDAATAYATLVRQYPENGRAPELLAGIAKAARRNGMARLALSQQEEYVTRYGTDGAFWKQAGANVREQIREDLRPFLGELAALYHADAQQQKNAASRDKAIRYYSDIVTGFPDDKELPRILFMRGEAYTEAGNLVAALADYDRSAGSFGPHDKAAEASYASLVTSEKLISLGKTSDERRARLRELVARSSRFAASFAADTRVDAVLVKAGEDILALGEPAEAVTLGGNLLARNPAGDVKRRAQVIYAHGLFETRVFDKAEAAYQAALATGGHSGDAERTLRDRLAVSIYRQGEAERAAGKGLLASETFLRIARVVPESEAAGNGQIDGAALLIENKRWVDAIPVLERFAKERPKHALISTVPVRLAVAYENTGRLVDAAEMQETLSRAERDPALAAQQLIRAAELRDKGGKRALAAGTYENYLVRFPEPMERAVEVRQTLADFAAQAGDLALRDRWLNEIISVQVAAGSAASVRVRFLAARAHLAFGDAKAKDFEAIRLKLPFDKSLAEKRRAMEDSLRWFDAAARYGIVEVTTAATYKMGEVYRRLARDVMDSEKPSGLKALEAEQYKILLEEEALPFEDKATKLHEVNVEKIALGGYDEWVRRSLASLRVLSPGRYDRVEVGETYFAYAMPKLVPVVPVAPAAPVSTPAASAAKNSGGANAKTGR